MKKIIFIILVFTLSYQAEGQRFLGALAFGGNLTQVDGDEVYGYKKPGFNIGASTWLPLWSKWYISLEIAYSQKGAYQKNPVISAAGQGLPYYNLRLDYLEIPLLFHFQDKQFAMIGTGFSLNRLVRAKEIEWGLQTPTTSRNGVYTLNDINWMVDVRLRVYKSLRVNFRYAYSIDKIRTRTYTNLSGEEWTRKQFNNVLTLRLVYTFNEKFVVSEDSY